MPGTMALHHKRAITVLFSYILIISIFTARPSYGELPVAQNGESPFTSIYEKLAPTVVLIEIESGKEQQKSPQERLLERYFNIPMPDGDNQKRQQQGMGSGVIIDRDGHILTNNHVVEEADKITVTIDENVEYKASIVGTDPKTDLAVIKLDLDGEQLPQSRVAQLGDSDTLKPGDYAIAIGNPVGLERTITVGVISGLGRHDMNVYGAQRLQFQDFIQTDAQINPGNSGGALADINGKVIGINNMYARAYAAIGFAIPINLAKTVSERIIEFGSVKRGFVGISWPRGEGDITPEIQEAMELPSTDGVLIIDVIDGSPAQEAGLEHGDVILKLDGVIIKDTRDFLFKIGDHMPGDTVELAIIRDKKNKTIEMTLADRDDFEKFALTGNTPAWLGINVVELNSSMAQQYDLEGISSGVVIAKIDEGSPAEDANIREGDVIIEIEERSVKNIEDFINIQEEFEKSSKPILIYRLRKMSGRIEKGYVAIKQK